MKWCFCFSILIVFHLQLCNSSSISYVFTQHKYGTHVCKSGDYWSNCPKRTDPIFKGDKKNMPMNLGFLNFPSDKFYDDYNMTEYGFPIFYEYFLYEKKLKINLIIANGKQASDKQGEYFYVTLIDEEGICRETRPKSEKETLSGALYLNQKFAKYAYFIYQSSSSSTCILTIKFEDLFQGDYRTDELVTIKPKEIILTERTVQNFEYPFFTIDPILGTYVYLLKNGNKLSAVHYIINENDLTGFDKILSFQLPPDAHKPEETMWPFKEENGHIEFKSDVLPVFTSYGNSTFFFLRSTVGNSAGVTGFWSPKQFEGANVQAKKNDDRRHFYFLDFDFFINVEPYGKYVESPPTSPLPYASESSALVSNCEEVTYLGLFIAFAIIDFLLMLGLLGLGITIWFGSKKMKRLRHLQNQRRGIIPKQLTLYGETTATTVAQPSAKSDGKGTIAPTDLNTQFTTTKAITVTRGGIVSKPTNVQGNGNTTVVTKQQQTTNQVTAPVPTKTIDAKKTTMLQTWK